MAIVSGAVGIVGDEFGLGEVGMRIGPGT